MTIPDRIERAARAVARMEELEFDDLFPNVQEDFRELARAVLLAAEPELYSDPPTHTREPIDDSHELTAAEESAWLCDWWRKNLKDLA